MKGDGIKKYFMNYLSTRGMHLDKKIQSHIHQSDKNENVHSISVINCIFLAEQ